MRTVREVDKGVKGCLERGLSLNTKVALPRKINEIWETLWFRGEMRRDGSSSGRITQGPDPERIRDRFRYSQIGHQPVFKEET